MVAELAKGLHRLGHQVTVFATGDSCPAGALSYHFSRPVWPPNDFAELRHAGQAFREIAQANAPFDVVHVNHAVALPFQPFLSLPMVLTVHHERVNDLVDHYRTYPDVSYIAISRRQAELSPELTFRRVIHHGLDPDNYPEGDGAGGYVAYLGRFAPEKGTHLAIDAACAAGVTVRLGGNAHSVATAYFESEVKPRLERAGERAVWCGELSHEPKVEHLRHARALLVPLQWEEPFGLVMIEAMLVGTPVIAFARGSAPEIVEEGVTGYLVRDVAEMAERIRQVDRIDRKRCRERARERWSTLRMAREYAELYESLARARRQSGANVFSMPDLTSGVDLRNRQAARGLAFGSVRGGQS